MQKREMPILKPHRRSTEEGKSRRRDLDEKNKTQQQVGSISRKSKGVVVQEEAREGRMRVGEGKQTDETEEGRYMVTDHVMLPTGMESPPPAYPSIMQMDSDQEIHSGEEGRTFGCLSIMQNRETTLEKHMPILESHHKMKEGPRRTDSDEEKTQLGQKVKSIRKTKTTRKAYGGRVATTTVTRKRKVNEEQVKDGGVAAAAATNWMDLQPELLELIARKLTNICDYIRFRGVCARWRSSAGTGGPHRWLPWLIYSPPEDGNTLPIFNPADRCFYYLSLPEEARGKSVVGSAHGWLAMSDRYCRPGCRKISLYHPFTRACIVLPTVLTSFLGNVIICCNPATASPRQLLASILLFKQLLIYRQGDDTCAEIKSPPGFSDFIDIIYLEEKATLYAVCPDGKLAVLDLASSTMQPLIDTPSPEIVSLYREVHLVFAAGDLLLLIWDSVRSRAPKFVVFKLDRSKEGCFKWVRAATIGDSTLLFVSRNHSVSANVVCDLDFPDGRANQIYYFRDMEGSYMNGYSGIGADIEVRDFNSDREQLCFRTSGRVRHMMDHSPRLAWMVPVLN